MPLVQPFLQHWEKHKFNTPGARTLVAVSGGMDSMALAHLFLACGMPFAIAHCNFKLRPVDADLDEQLVRDWAERHQIRLHSIAFDTAAEMNSRKKAVQETARSLRYEWFDHLCRTEGYTAVATAHHAQDNAETLLMHLCKGTGMAGLHGIPVRNGRIIRPLLFASRQDIAAYITSHHIPYREDSSNAGDKYLRNAVRHKIIPALNELFPDVVQRLQENIQRFTEAEQIYNKAIALERKKLMEQRGADWYIPVLKLSNRQPLATICYELFSDFGFSVAQVPHILSLLHSESGHFVASASHRVIRNRNMLIITAQKTDQTDFIRIDAVPVSISAGQQVFHFRVSDKQEPIPTDTDTASVDLDKIDFPLVLRRWRTGDYFYPLGMGMKKKKVSKLFGDLKIPLHQKEQTWILESNRRIVWVSGMRLDERFKITPQTRNRLQVSVT